MSSSQPIIASAEECAAILKNTIAEYKSLLQRKGTVTQADAETLITAATVSIANRSADPKNVPKKEIADTIVNAITDLDSGMVDRVIETAANAIYAIASRAPEIPAAADAGLSVSVPAAPAPEIAPAPETVQPPEAVVVADPVPVKKEPMPREIWQDLYAMRNGQLVILYSLETDADTSKIRRDIRSLNSRNNWTDDNILTGKLDYLNPLNTNLKGKINSWGDFVEFAVLNKLDLTGLTLSPLQKNYLFENELQNKNLKEAKLNFANLDHLNLTGTQFNSATLNQASLRHVSGADTKFNGTKGDQLDLSGANLIRPDFREMVAPRSVHVWSTYDHAEFGKTNWTSSRLVGARLMLKYAEHPLDISGSLVAGCLLYGVGTEIVQPKMTYTKASFPGTAFYNIGLVAGKDRGVQADFSPLLRDDPRLSAEERDHVFAATWINGTHGLDGLLVSPHVKVAEESEKKLTVFSEVQFSPSDKAKPEDHIMFFSKGPVIERSSFHDIRITALDDILPEPVLKLMRKIETPVISPAAPEPAARQEPEKKASTVPLIAVDKEAISQQIEGLKKASMAEAMALGNSVQVSFSEASTVVTNWAMARLAQKSEFAEKIGGLIAALDTYSIIPEPDAQPEPDPELEEALPPKPVHGIMESVMRGFRGGPSAEEIAWQEAVARREQKILERQRAAEQKAAAKARDPFDINISKDLASLSTAATAALKNNMTGLEDVEALHNYLGTLKDVIKTYVSGIETVVPSLVTENPSVIKIAEMCKHNMTESYNSLDRLDNGIRTYMDAVVDNGIAVHNVQGKILDLNIHFNKAAGLHSLNKALETSPEGYRQDQKLAGLYALVVTAAPEQKPARTQVQEAFMQAKVHIVDSLRDAHEVMEKAGEQRKAALNAILNPI